MAVVREFFLRDRPGDVEGFALARDVITDRVFVLHSRGRSKPELSYNENQISLKDFLQGEGPEQMALLDHARELRPELPIVYMSGGNAHGWSSHGVPNSTIVQKPFAPAQIVTAISALINISDAHHAGE